MELIELSRIMEPIRRDLLAVDDTSHSSTAVDQGQSPSVEQRIVTRPYALFEEFVCDLMPSVGKLNGCTEMTTSQHAEHRASHSEKISIAFSHDHHADLYELIAALFYKYDRLPNDHKCWDVKRPLRSECKPANDNLRAIRVEAASGKSCFVLSAVYDDLFGDFKQEAPYKASLSLQPDHSPYRRASAFDSWSSYKEIATPSATSLLLDECVEASLQAAQACSTNLVEPPFHRYCNKIVQHVIEDRFADNLAGSRPLFVYSGHDSHPNRLLNLSAIAHVDQGKSKDCEDSSASRESALGIPSCSFSTASNKKKFGLPPALSADAAFFLNKIESTLGQRVCAILRLVSSLERPSLADRWEPERCVSLLSRIGLDTSRELNRCGLDHNWVDCFRGRLRGFAEISAEFGKAKVSYRDCPELPCLAFSLDDKWSIYCHKRMSERRQAWSIMHEVAHILLEHEAANAIHFDLSSVSSDEKKVFLEQEYQANLFADLWLYSIGIFPDHKERSVWNSRINESDDAMSPKPTLRSTQLVVRSFVKALQDTSAHLLGLLRRPPVSAGTKPKRKTSCSVLASQPE